MCNPPPIQVNDVHSGLNPTTVNRVETPATLEQLVTIVNACAQRGEFLSVAGCRHAMGGQQFLSNGVLIDTRRLPRILDFDTERGLIRAEAGIQWPELVTAIRTNLPKWSIRQKQTGADNFTLGGSVSANAHGRGLELAPLVTDVEAFTLLNADGQLIPCSRAENVDLFRLAIGGYGLFGIVTDVTLRLVPQQRLERLVEIIPAAELIDRFNQRITEGCTYGDFQFSIDENSADFLQHGILSCYRPTNRLRADKAQRQLQTADWLRLLYLAHADRKKVFDEYSALYSSTNGQLYWADTHQLGPYLPDYAAKIHELGGTQSPATLMISELYVPREHLAAFLADAAESLRSSSATVIYGTIRLIKKDTESFLAWARESFACIIFNLLVEPSNSGKTAAAEAFRTLIDLAIKRRGSFFLTYHRWATREQVDACYPQFGQFLALKRQHDPSELFQSDWYRHFSLKKAQTFD
ncbi:MAG TPA: FAD-binding oxidoreductase [Chthoniobacterales bacterium]